MESLSRSSSRPSETAQDAAEEAGKEDTKRLNADVPESLYTRVRMEAARQDTSIKDVVIQGMEQYLDKQE